MEIAKSTYSHECLYGANKSRASDLPTKFKTRSVTKLFILDINVIIIRSSNYSSNYYFRKKFKKFKRLTRESLETKFTSETKLLINRTVKNFDFLL